MLEAFCPLSGDGYASSDSGVDNVVGVAGAMNAFELEINGESSKIKKVDTQLDGVDFCITYLSTAPVPGPITVYNAITTPIILNEAKVTNLHLIFI